MTCMQTLKKAGRGKKAVKVTEVVVSLCYNLPGATIVQHWPTPQLNHRRQSDHPEIIVP